MAHKEYNENDITDAILAITDEGLSQNQASQRYGIPRTTLISRIRGNKAQGDQIQPNQRRTNNEKKSKPRTEYYVKNI
jgi:transposase